MTWAPPSLLMSLRRCSMIVRLHPRDRQPPEARPSRASSPVEQHHRCPKTPRHHRRSTPLSSPTHPTARPRQTSNKAHPPQSPHPPPQNPPPYSPSPTRPGSTIPHVPSSPACRISHLSGLYSCRSNRRHSTRAVSALDGVARSGLAVPSPSDAASWAVRGERPRSHSSRRMRSQAAERPIVRAKAGSRDLFGGLGWGV